MSKKGKKPHSEKVSKKEHKLSQNLGTKKDEFGVQGSTMGMASPRRRWGKPAKSGTKTPPNHR